MYPNWYVAQEVPDQRIWKTVFCGLCVLCRQTPNFKNLNLFKNLFKNLKALNLRNLSEDFSSSSLAT